MLLQAFSKVTFTYDAAGNRKQMDDGLGTQSYTYDSLSRLTSETRTFADPASPYLNGAFTLNYHYNRAGGLKTITDGFGTTTDYGRDSAGQLTGVTGSGGATVYASGITYRASGGLKHMDYGNSLKLDMSYNNRLQKTQFDVTDSAGAQVAGWQYQYASDGQVSYSHDLRDNRLDRAYSYDHVSRLITGLSGNEARGDLSYPPTGPYKQTYGQNVWGNLTDRTMRVVGPYGYPIINSYHDSYTNNRNVGGSSQPWVYDADGRLTNDRTRTYSFDVAGNQVTNSENAISRSFDGDGQMLKKSQSGAITYYLRSSVVKEVIDELNQSGQKQRGYVYRDGEMLARQEGGSVLWNHDEPSSTSSQWANGSGGVTSRVEMDPLMTQVAEDNGFTGGGYSAGNPMGFYGNSSNMGAGCAARGAGIACGFNFPVPLSWISAMTFGFQITNYTTTTTNRTQVQISHVSSTATPAGATPSYNLGGGSYQFHITQVPVTTTTLQTSYVFLPVGSFGWQPGGPTGPVGPQNSGAKQNCTFPTYEQLSDAQKALLNSVPGGAGEGFYSGLSDAQRASFLNLTGALKAVGISTSGLGLESVAPDRLLFSAGTTAGFQTSFEAAVAAKKFSNSPPAESEHKGMSKWGGRQKVSSNALQIGGGQAGAFVDIDYGNPQTFKGFFIHLGEVTKNKVTKNVTDPFKVGRALGSEVTGYTCK